jgi:hypothetical protein
MGAEDFSNAVESVAMRSGAETLNSALLDAVRSSAVSLNGHVACASESSLRAQKPRPDVKPVIKSESSDPKKRPRESFGGESAAKRVSLDPASFTATPPNKARPKSDTFTPSSTGQTAKVETPSGPSSAATAFASRKSPGQLLLQYAGEAARPPSDITPFVPANDVAVREDAAESVSAIVESLGRPAVRGETAVWAGGAGRDMCLEVHSVSADEASFGLGSLTSSYRFMFETLEQRVDSTDRRVSEMSAISAGEDTITLHPIGEVSQDPVLVAGRVVCDSEGEGRLNPASVLLEGSRAESGGARCHLDLMECKAFTLFPGQVVVAEGMMPTADKLVVSALRPGVPCPLPRSPMSVLRTEAERAASTGSGPMRMWVAAGPYTLATDLEFLPLTELLRQVVSAAVSPDVLVLQGPFIDSEHKVLRGGRARLTLPNGTVIACTMKDVFMYQCE